MAADHGLQPGLAVVIIGEDPASQVYVRMKGKACEKLGMKSETISMPTETTEEELLDVVDRLNTEQRPAIEARAQYLLAEALHMEALARLEAQR